MTSACFDPVITSHRHNGCWWAEVLLRKKKSRQFNCKTFLDNNIFNMPIHIYQLWAVLYSYTRAPSPWVSDYISLSEQSLPCCLPLCPPCFPLLRFHAASSQLWFPWLSCVSFVIHRKLSRVQISRAKLEDSGNYTCVVENSLGKDNSTGTVNVQSSKYPLLSNERCGTDALLLLRLFSCQLRGSKGPSQTGMQH